MTPNNKTFGASKFTVLVLDRWYAPHRNNPTVIGGEFRSRPTESEGELSHGIQVAAVVAGAGVAGGMVGVAPSTKTKIEYGGAGSGREWDTTCQSLYTAVVNDKSIKVVVIPIGVFHQKQPNAEPKILTVSGNYRTFNEDTKFKLFNSSFDCLTAWDYSLEEGDVMDLDWTWYWCQVIYIRNVTVVVSAGNSQCHSAKPYQRSAETVNWFVLLPYVVVATGMQVNDPTLCPLPHVGCGNKPFVQNNTGQYCWLDIKTTSPWVSGTPLKDRVISAPAVNWVVPILQFNPTSSQYGSGVGFAMTVPFPRDKSANLALESAYYNIGPSSGTSFAAPAIELAPLSLFAWVPLIGMETDCSTSVIVREWHHRTSRSLWYKNCKTTTARLSGMLMVFKVIRLIMTSRAETNIEVI